MKAALVIMAAGLGSRYGGNKQVEGIGPSGEILMEYSIHDALRAGFTKVVFIIKPDMVDLMERLVGRALSSRKTAAGEAVELAYAIQDFTTIPDFYTIPEGRTKPFGTVHAVLCARSVVSEPFCVINADDYYGVDAYHAIYEELGRLPATGGATMVGYLLKNTASLHGTVSRGVCQTTGNRLSSIKEALKIQLYSDGRLTDLLTEEQFDPDTPVSMNFWGFTPAVFQNLEDYFYEFLRNKAGVDSKAECLLPLMVGQLLETKAVEVSVLRSVDRWFGMTYQEDRPVVAEELRKLHQAGVYPPSLRD